MLRLISEETQIKKAQQQLSKTIISSAENHGEISIGGKGWNQRARHVYWNKKYGFWWTTREEEDRYWNSFGLNEPKWNTKYSHNIIVEINLPKGTNSRLSGLITVDGENKTYLMHRGITGGGRKGIGKTLFSDNFEGNWEDVWEENAISKVAFVAVLNSPRFLRQLSVFVKDVARIKDKRIEKITPKETPPDIFTREFQGKKQYNMPNEIEAKCDHGLVISNLMTKLKDQGLRVGNRGRLDLYVLGKDDEISTLYEAKTDDSLNSCCHAIGQLLYYSRRLEINPRLVAVFPGSITNESRKVFKNLNIDVLTYTWLKNEPYFKNVIH